MEKSREYNARKLTPLEHYLADELYEAAVPGLTYGDCIEQAVKWTAPMVHRILREHPDTPITRNEYDIPADAVLPYICKERDKAQKKAEDLEGYARGLEIRIEELTAKLEDATAALDAVQNKQLKDEALKLTANQRKQTRLLLKQAVNAISQIENFVRTDG